MPTLYALADNFRVALALADDYAYDHAGEIPEDLADALDKMEGDRDVKLANVLRAMKNEATDAEAFKTEAVRLAKKAATKSARVEWFKNYLAVCLGEGNEWKDDVFALSWQDYPKVEVLDATKIPKKFLRVVPATSAPDLAAIKAALKTGDVKGVKLDPNPKLKIK
jgi:hypothetical protein